jgi:hypothetical protein
VCSVCTICWHHSFPTIKYFQQVAQSLTSYQQHTVMAFITSVTHCLSPWTSTCLPHAYLNCTPTQDAYGAYHNQPYWLTTHTYFSLTTPILRLICLLWLLFLDFVTLKMDDRQYDPLKCVELLTQQCSESAAHQLWECQISQYARLWWSVNLVLFN